MYLKYFCNICLNVCHQETQLSDIIVPVDVLRRLQKQPSWLLMLNLYVSGSLSHSRTVPVAFPFSFRTRLNRSCYGFVVGGQPCSVLLINTPQFCMSRVFFTLLTNSEGFCLFWFVFPKRRMFHCVIESLFLFKMEGGDVVKIAQLANITGGQNRISQPETPVTLQFQGNKFTLSPSQLRQLTTGQPLQLQGTTTKDHVVCSLLSFSVSLSCPAVQPTYFIF